MEKRKIYINDTASNRIVTLETDATTFGQVKRAAVEAGITVDGKDWLEGITRTTPVDDNSLLPTNIDYKGSKTNDLIFVLTMSNHKTKSGAMTRKELYVILKEDKELQKAIVKKFKRNYTQVSTEELQKIVSSGNTHSCGKQTTDVPNNSKTSTKVNNVDNSKKDDEKLTGLYTAIAHLLANLDEEAYAFISKKTSEILKENQTVSLDFDEVRSISNKVKR